MDADAQNRLWQHRLHEDMIFWQRQNLFLVGESMLTAACVTALAGDQALLVARAVAIIGIILTAAWLDGNRRQRYIMGNVHERAMKNLQEFADTYRTRQRRRIG